MKTRHVLLQKQERETNRLRARVNCIWEMCEMQIYLIWYRNGWLPPCKYIAKSGGISNKGFFSDWRLFIIKTAERDPNGCWWKFDFNFLYKRLRSQNFIRYSRSTIYAVSRKNPCFEGRTIRAHVIWHVSSTLDKIRTQIAMIHEEMYRVFIWRVKQIRTSAVIMQTGVIFHHKVRLNLNKITLTSQLTIRMRITYLS